MTSDGARVSWFEVPARDLERARAFYERVLEIQMTLFEPGPFRMAWFPGSGDDGEPIGALMESVQYVPSHEGTLLYFEVEDVEVVLKRVERAGGRVISPKVGIGDFGYVGHFEDPDGNRIGLRSSR